MLQRLTALIASLSFLTYVTVALACQTVTPQQVANALANAPGLNPGLQSCAMAAMAMKESGGGNTCAQNSCCVGILQLNVGPSGLDYSAQDRAAYLNADLQTQVNGWAATANSNASSSGYQTLLGAYNSGTPINGYPVTAGTLAACEQFGARVCNNNVQSLQSSGSCGSYTDGTSHTGGQTICSWGHAADQQAANQNCQMNGQKGGTNCPDINTTPGGVISPSPSDAPLSLPDNVG